MPIAILPNAEFGRRQIRDAILGGTVRDATFQAAVIATIAKWSLLTIDATTFGKFANPSGDSQCSITAGARTLTSANTPFLATDAGRSIDVQGAGAAGATLRSTIVSVQSTSQVTLADAAITTVTSTFTSTAGLAVWGDPVASGDEVRIGQSFDGLPNVAALRALQAPQVNEIYRTQGYYVQGDGGGASYRWNPTDVGTDDGGSVIAATGIANGRFNLIRDHVLNVRQFGAKGDGVTNDLAAIVAAGAASTGPVLIPPGATWNYGGSVSFTQEWTFYDWQNSAATPHTSQVINRNVSSLGTAAQQYGGLIVYDTVNAGATHNEYGLFGVVNSFTSLATLQHVGIYGQCNQLSVSGGTASPCWAMVAQVGNIINGGAVATNDAVLTGIEVDVDNKFAFSATVRKIGVECIAYGGGENNEAFALAAANDTSANGSYNSGNWRIGLWVRPNSLHATAGIGVKVDSSMGTGVQILGVAGTYGLHLASGGGPTGIYVDAAWTTPITITADKSIKLNDSAGTQGISYVSARTAVELNAAAAGVSNHSTQAAATAGGGAAVPASVTGFLKFYVNGFEKRIPYFNP